MTGPTDLPPGRQEPRAGFDELHASQRIAYGAAVRSIGDILAKPASLLFYVVMARELGESSFGVFNFGLSLASVVLVLAGLGLQELVAREVARDPTRADYLVWNAIALRGLMIVGLLALIVVIVVLDDYSAESTVAIAIVAVGVGMESLTGILYAVFQAFERQQHIATTLLINRFSTAILGIGALLAGAGLVVVCVIATLGSALGLGMAFLLMQKRVVRPRRYSHTGAWGDLITRGFSLGVLGILGQTVLRSSVVLLGFIGASSAEVGEYSAAFRLIEATLFVSWSFSGAVMPWFSRHADDRSSQVGLARAFELALKGVISVMLPIALTLALFAEPLIETLYGVEYDGAITPLRILAAMTVLWGINGVISAVLVGLNRPRAYLAPAATAIVLTGVLAATLIPEHGAIGAALTTVPAAGVLALLTITATIRLVGRVSAIRIIAAPALAAGALAGAAVALSAAPWPLAAAGALTLYAAVFLSVERATQPDDFAYYRRILGR